MPLLPFVEGLVKTTHFDAEMAMLADRHYSRRTLGAQQFLYAGRKLVLRDAAGLVLFGWMWPYPEMRADNEQGYCCAIFRNESPRQSSEIILEAEEWVQRFWGPGRMFTYVNPRKVASANPGYCFKVAGWRFVRKSLSGLHLLEKLPERVERTREQVTA